MKLASGFCTPEPLPVHTGIKGRQAHPLIRFKIVAWGHNVSLPSIRVQLRSLHQPPLGYVLNLDVPYLSVTTSYVVTTLGSYGKRHKLNPVTTLWHADVDKRVRDRQMPCKRLQPSYRSSAN